MPLIFITRSGSTPISNMASMMRSEMALWPQPAHSVLLPPRYSRTGRPMWLTLGLGVAVAILEALLGCEFIGNEAGVHRQSVVVENAAQLGYLVGGKIELEQAGQLRVAVLFDHVDALVGVHKVVNLVREGIGADAHVVRVPPVLLLDLVQALAQREVGGSVSQEADLRGLVLHRDRAGNQLARILELARQPLHQGNVLLRLFGVAGLVGMSRAAGEIDRKSTRLNYSNANISY